MLYEGRILTESSIIEQGTTGVGLSVEQTSKDGFSSLSVMQETPVLTSNAADLTSKYLQRVLKVVIYNPNTKKSFTFEGNKMSISGSKFIGMQQDEFRIVFQNIEFYKFGLIVNSGYKLIEVILNNFKVFSGTIKSINTGRDSIVEKTIELNCLRKVTDFLSDMVTPITVNSSINIWATLSSFIPLNEETTINGNLELSVPSAFKDLNFDRDYTFSGTKKTVIDDIIKITNDQLSRTNNANLNWIDYTYEQEGVINLFSPYTIPEVLILQPMTGLIDTPTVNEDSISFSSIFKEKLVPGRVVKLDNSLFKTIGNASAFIYAWDINGQYVITEVRYTLSNYPNSYTCSCKARPLSKYNNFTASLEG